MSSLKDRTGEVWELANVKDGIVILVTGPPTQTTKLVRRKAATPSVFRRPSDTPLDPDQQPANGAEHPVFQLNRGSITKVFESFDSENSFPRFWNRLA